MNQVNTLTDRRRFIKISQSDAESYMSRFAYLRNKGVSYPDYRIFEDGRLQCWKGMKWQWKTPHRRGDYLGYKVKNPQTGKWDWVMAHAATEESFNGGWAPGLVACHKSGTSKCDIALGSCRGFDTVKSNRLDRYRDGTQSTSSNTKPGKLYLTQIMHLHVNWKSNPNASYWAKRFGCTAQAIRYHIKKRQLRYGK